MKLFIHGLYPGIIMNIVLARKLKADGSFFVSANLAFGDSEGWRGESRVP